MSQSFLQSVRAFVAACPERTRGLAELKAALQRETERISRCVAAGAASPNVGRSKSIARGKVAKLWGQGYSQAEIAKRLKRSASGVRSVLLEIGQGQLPPR